MLCGRAPQSVDERRRDFLRQIGINLSEVEREAVGSCCDECGGVCVMGDEFSSSWETDDLGLCRNGDGDEDSGGVLGAYGSGDESSSRRSSVSSWDTDDPGLCRNVDRENKGSVNTPKPRSNLRTRWLRRLRSMACMTSGGMMTMKEDGVGCCGSGQVEGSRMLVRHCQRRSKELSALFRGQEIQAHEGAIKAMSFSLDGNYLASAGEDTIIMVWQVVEDEKFDPSCASSPSIIYPN